MFQNAEKKIEEREVVVLDNQGQKVFGMLHRPLGIEKPPIVLICHGLAGNKIGKFRVYVQLSKILVEAGIASLRIDFRGSGDSEGDFSDLTLESEVSDALKALDYMQQLPWIDSHRIGIFGRSVGGLIALLAARRHGNIKSIAVWAPLFDGHQWREQWNIIHASGLSEKQRLAALRINGQVPGEEFFKQLFSVKMNEELEKLEGVPFLHIHGEKDTTVTLKHAEHFAEHGSLKASEKVRFIRLPLSDHDFSDPEERLLAMKETKEWFLQTL